MKKLFLFLILPLIHSCFSSELVFEDQFRVVAEAYLYAGQESSTLKISTMVSFGSDSTGGSPVKDALVSLLRSWQKELKTAMFLTGCGKVADLRTRGVIRER